jgi:hypothetical protein
MIALLGRLPFAARAALGAMPYQHVWFVSRDDRAAGSFSSRLSRRSMQGSPEACRRPSVARQTRQILRRTR